ncbi:hypothetical protein EVAR_63717_1 [Eumeta japonica]|uniref:Uncharacterized protein n=1 Tax=Eumeta variegata TaxID=151549 RepID=A0A4C1ZWH0_EUMVA|nr:hypothetical protein EVAR_63717_1 [Eumeta japonica]
MASRAPPPQPPADELRAAFELSLLRVALSTVSSRFGTSDRRGGGRAAPRRTVRLTMHVGASPKGSAAIVDRLGSSS